MLGPALTSLEDYGSVFSQLVDKDQAVMTKEHRLV